MGLIFNIGESSWDATIWTLGFFNSFPILKAIIENEPKTNEDVLNLVVDGETVNDLIVNKTAKIGEKLSFRRFSKIEKNDEQVFGSYIHMGGKIAVLTRLNGANEEVAKDVAMHAAAMRPSVVRREQVPQEEIEKEREIVLRHGFFFFERSS